MKSLKIIYVGLLLIILFPFIASAQDSTKSEFSASVNYQSKLHYFGRTDSLQSSGLFPSIGYQFKFGLYAQGNFIFIQNPAIPLSYTGTTVEGGFRFKQTKHFNGNIFYTQFLYKDKTSLVQSALHSQTGINLAYTNNILNLNGGADLKFSDKTDIGITAGVDHLFIIKVPDKKMAFAFDPSAYAYMGTQNFSNTYIQNKNVLGVPVTQQYTTTVTQFNVLSYEVSMPVVFVAGKFNASVIPSYVMPQNLISGERGSEMFYVALSIGIKL
ncbi:MAG: hypothetical protein C0459_06645 [Chitinophaga sp.]|jgi:hypothetical protein|nr:hypothetical protein [Chitinophaga sp.]